ncbi:alcohol dehydrogenase [Xaviernesmea oryzae]|uniref:Alcohol dehydrogenase n=1 Tax=Xaviernesmea oryzae TaxID=464029 RepID=A0A1Q9ATM3_9HYPH|nr:quinone oxidoreductase [Xaviernesmea oryzae]OLP58691.1 alcohol dehydrogenase [Xaviernesmea oryzae]SEK68288.1 NADPH2:quinone reductase [Xaviernesmea oryzae]
MDQKIELIAAGGIDGLRLADCPPQAPGEGEIRLRHQAAGINFIDIYHRTGLYPLPLPAVLGVEGAGVVEALGPGVTGLQVGDRIAYAGTPGAYAATRLLPAWRAIALPEDIETEAAAAAFLRGMTAHMLLTRCFPVEQGATLLIHAAAGGLGTALSRWAKHLGARVIGTVSNEEKAGIARENGVDHLILGRNADLAGEVARLTEGRGVDFAIDGLGGTMLRQTLACVRRFGTVASVGQAAGPIPPIPVEEIGPLRSLSLMRPSVMAYAAERETYPRAAEAVINALRQGLLPAPAHRYRLAEAGQAQADLEAGRTAGSVMLQF